MPAEEKLTNINDSSENPKLTNNLEEYNFNVSMYHKATKVLNSEIEIYCQKSEKNYFSKVLKLINSNKSNKEENLINKISTMLSDSSNTEAVFNFHNQVPIDSVGLKTNTEDIEVSSIKRHRNLSEKSVKIPSDSEFNLKTFLNQTSNDKIQIISTEKDLTIESDNILPSKSENSSECIEHQSVNNQIDKFINCTENQGIFDAPKYDAMHFRHFSEPAFIHTSNLNYPMTSIYSFGPNFNSGTIPSHSKIQSYQNYYHSNNPNVNSNHNPISYLGHFNSQTFLGPNNNLFYHSQHQQQQQYINYILPNQSNLYLSPKNTIPGHNISGIYGGLLYPQTAFMNNNLNSNLMHNNIQYSNPVDHNLRQQTVEPVLTRSLPSIIGSPTASESTMASTIIQTSIAPCLPSRTPNINNTTGINEIPVSQRQILVPSNSTQKLNPILMSTPRPIINRNQAAISPIPTSKVQEKSKPKKPKTRLKSKYLLRIIEIVENSVTREITLVFEMMLPMNQMRFTCSLNSDINLSKCLGDPGQMPGELRKKEILESLVNTVKKICDCLLEDMNSIPLNEDFVFHPYFPNSGLVKFSDCTYQMQISSEVYESSQSNSGLLNQYNYLNTIPSHMIGNPLTVSSASSRSLSRHASTEDLYWNLNNPSFPLSEQTWLPVPEMETINPLQVDSSKMPNSVIDILKKPKPITEIETNRNIKMTSKCSCNPPSKDCCVKIPEYIFPSVKQIIDKLQNPHTKGLIILPQSNEIFLRNLRILEIPADHIFFGLPCSDSSFNVVKGHKDNDFIIAKNNRQPESTSNAKKCVYQIPNDGAVLLDSTGEIQYLQQPSLVIPSHAQLKAQIKELPFELTHNKNQSLDCNQIVSVLQSLSMMQNSIDLTKDETFDSPIMLESVVNQQSIMSDKFDPGDLNQQRRGSGDIASGSAMQNPSQVQVECVSFQFVPSTKSVSSKLEAEPEFIDRDLPRQQVRNRKISNESLDAISTSRSRGPTVYLNEVDHLSSTQPIMTKMVGIQNVQRTVPVGTLLNQIPVQRLPNPNSVGHSGQFVLSAQTSINQLPSNILMHNLPPGVAQYGNPTSGSTPVTVVMSQSSSSSVPVVLNQNPIGLNYTPIVPNQVVLSSGMMTNQMSQMHIQQQQSQLANQPRMPPPNMSISSQHLSNLQQGLPIQNLINPSQSMISGSILPGYTNSMHNSIPTATSEAHFVPVSHPTEFIGLKDQVRQMPTVNIRQMPPSFYDSNYSSPIMPDHNFRIRSQPNSTQSQSQPTPVLYFPMQNLATTTIQNSIPTGVNNTSKLGLSDQPPIHQQQPPLLPPPPQQQQQQQLSSIIQPPESIAINNPMPESDKVKTEQTIGRFVIRPVTENIEKT